MPAALQLERKDDVQFGSADFLVAHARLDLRNGAEGNEQEHGQECNAFFDHRCDFLRGKVTPMRLNDKAFAPRFLSCRPMGSVLCMIYRQQPKQPIQQAKLSPLYRLSCYILRTTTGTTCTTKKVVPVVLVVVLYFKDDNWNNLYNQESCPRCSGCRAIF